MNEDYTLIAILYFVLAALVGAAIGAAKGRAKAGFLFGLLIGPIGWIVIAVGPEKRSGDVFVPATNPSADDAHAALRKVFDAGLITAVEYDTKKAKLEQRAAEKRTNTLPANYRIPGINE